MCPEQESTEGTESTFCLAHSAADGPCSRCSDHTDGRVDVRRRATLGRESYGNCESSPLHSHTHLRHSHHPLGTTRSLSPSLSLLHHPSVVVRVTIWHWPAEPTCTRTRHTVLLMSLDLLVSMSHTTLGLPACACAVLQGGTSSVYPVTHKESGRKYALKVIGMERLSKAKREQLLVEVDIM
jgi:hypothetical protein